MNDCPNADMRDQLCDVVHRTLADADCKRVEDHIATCAECTAEIALLRRAQAVLARDVPSVDTAAIVAALPRRRASRAPSFSSWRIAASIAVIAVGAASLSLARLQQSAGDDVNSPQATSVASTSNTHSLSFAGRLSNLEDEDLQQLLAEIDEFDGAAPIEPSAVLPVPAWEGGRP